MINLEAPGALKQLSERIKNEIDTYCSDKYDDGPRSHLGASEIGDSCSKKLWLKFRWTAHKKHDGRQQRLFQRGHFEEPRFVSYLEGIGCKVQMFAKSLWWHPESESYFIESVNYQKEHAGQIDAELCVDVTDIPEHLKRAEEQNVKFDKGKMQIRISACKGHFGGSIDGLCTLPERYGIPEDVVFLDEFKTQGLGKQGNKVSNFEKLVKQGVKEYKPVHWAQKCIYGYKLDVNYGIYMSANKNDDDLHIEVVKLDHCLGASLERKAELIIFSETAPAGVSMSPSYFECSYCDFKGVCYGTELPLKNCRSCCNCFPTDTATWTCKFHGVVPKEVIGNEQPCWESII